MPTFQYKALQANGTMAEGQLEAAGRPDAFRQIEALGLRPVSLCGESRRRAKTATVPSPAGAGRPRATFRSSFKSNKVSAKDLENFTRLLSSLLAAGVPLSRALVILHKEASNPAVAAKWKEIHDYVIDGMSLADAMAKSPETFPRVYTAMVQAGETGGFLDVVLAQIADFQSREKELKSKVMTAMLYPCILLVLALGVLTFLLVFFIPRFQKIFAGFGGSLPLITQIIVGVSNVMRSYGLFVAGRRGRRRAAAAQLVHLGEGPARLGRIDVESAGCRAAGRAICHGAVLPDARHAARRRRAAGPGAERRPQIHRQPDSRGRRVAIDRARAGRRAAGRKPGGLQGLFPGSVLEMISVAEESGRLDAELVRIANVTEGDLDRQLKTAVAFAEPVMLFLIAGFIGTIFIGMLLPIFSLQEYIK